MAFIPTPQCVEAKLIQTIDTQTMVNVWNIDVGHPVTSGDLTGVWSVIDAWITSNYKTIISAYVAFDQIIVTDISVANGEQYAAAPTTTGGAGATPSVVANVAIVASLRTSHIGRNFRGRTYVGGVPQAYYLTPTTCTAAGAITVNTAFTNLLTALTSAGYKLVVISKWLNKVARVVGLATEVISIIVDQRFDSQRRRLSN